MTLKQELEQFYGTENYYRISPFAPYVLTDGVKYLADKAQCYWLVNDIICNKLNTDLKDEEFIVIKTTKTDNGVVVNYEDGNKNKLYKETYPYSTLPDDGEFTLWFENNVIYLPSEH